MFRSLAWLAISSASLCSACALHPMPEDYTGLTTYQMTRQITCETRAAIIDSIFGFLTYAPNREEHVIGTHRFVQVDEHSFEVGRSYQEHPERLSRFSPSELTGTARAVVGLIWQTGIAYNYDLEMNEINNSDLTVNFLQAFTHSTFSLGIGTKTDLQRQNTRLFTTTATFGNLVAGPAANICKPEYLVGRNYLYPIAGHIGIEPVIQDFTQQALFGDLSQDFSKDFAKSTSPVQLAEQLQFTTTLDLSVTPKITFAPVPLIGSGLHVADATFSGEAQRKDVHKLSLGLFLPTPASVASLRGGVLANFYGVPLAGIVSAPAPTPGQKGALDVLNQLLVLRLFRRDGQVF